jgi:hypothetical protein
VLRSRMNADRWRDPERLAALTSMPGAPLPDRWDALGSQTRGGGVSAVNSGIAARVGALHLDLLVAARSRAPATRIAQLAATVVSLLDAVQGAGPVRAEYAAIADAPQQSDDRTLERLRAVAGDASAVTDPDYFALGAWTEAARLAAHRQDADFFGAREARAAVARAVELPGLDEAGRAAAARLRTLESSAGATDWAAVRDDLKVLGDALAR